MADSHCNWLTMINQYIFEKKYNILITWGFNGPMGMVQRSHLVVMDTPKGVPNKKKHQWAVKKKASDCDHPHIG